jgi:hypothetical protein
MKDPKEIAAEALVGAVVPSGLLLLTLALAGVNPDEVLAAIRGAPREDRALLAALVLASVLLVLGVWRRWGGVLTGRGRDVRGNISSEVSSATPPPVAEAPAQRLPDSSVGRPVSEPKDKGRTRKKAQGHVEVGDFIPQIAAMEHGGLRWLTTMPSIPDWATGMTYAPHPDSIEVRLPPVCPRCNTDLLEDDNSETKLEDVLAGRGVEVYCVECGFRHRPPKPLDTLRAEVTIKARGAVRRLERGERA